MSAQDKGSGKSQNITITSDKGRLSAEEIDRMLNEAEKNAEADKQLKEAIEAKNVLEMYLYQMKSAVKTTLKDKISKESDEKVMSTIRDAEAWLESNNSSTDKNVFEEKKQEVEAVVGPLVTEAYKAAAAASSSSGGSKKGPTVEEVDPSTESNDKDE